MCSSGAASRRPTGSGSASARCATRSPSSSPRTSSTAGSGCARSPHEARVGDGYELDDDPRESTARRSTRYLTRSYWAEGRPRELQDALIDSAARVVGLYHDGEQVGFSRAISDGHVQSYLADVYVLEDHRGRGLGVELVRFSVDEGPLAGTKWYLHTRDAHDLTASSASSSRASVRSSGRR